MEQVLAGYEYMGVGFVGSFNESFLVDSLLYVASDRTAPTDTVMFCCAMRLRVASPNESTQLQL